MPDHLWGAALPQPEGSRQQHQPGCHNYTFHSYISISILGRFAPLFQAPCTQAESIHITKRGLTHKHLSFLLYWMFLEVGK